MSPSVRSIGDKRHPFTRSFLQLGYTRWVQITEKWIAEAVGWPVFKEAKGIVAAGKVSNFQRKSDLHFSADVAQGKRVMKVDVEVRSATDVEARCQCRTFRDSGILCEHIAAVLYQSLQKNSGSQAAGSNRTSQSKNAKSPNSALADQQAYHIKIGLPTNTFDRWEQRETVAVGVDLQPANAEELCQNSLALNALLFQVNEGKPPQPGFWQMSAEALETLLEVATEIDSCIFQLDSKQQPQPIRYYQSDFARLTLDIGGSATRLSLQVSQPKLSENGELQMLYGERRLWFWDKTTRTLVMGQKLQRGLSQLCTQSKLLNQLVNKGATKASVTHFWRQWSTLEALYRLEWAPALRGMELKLATPKPVLRLEGSFRQLKADMRFRYDTGEELAELCFGKAEDADLFPYQLEDSLVWENRHAEFERNTLSQLVDIGFQPNPKGAHLGCFACQDEQTILKILLKHLGEKEAQWDIQKEEILENQLEGVERIEPHVSFATALDANDDFREGVAKGQDWLAFDIHFETADGTKLQREKVRQLLRSGKREIPLGGGRRGILFEEDGDQIDDILLDVNPNQQGASFFTNPAQALYLQRWQSRHSQQDNKATLTEKGETLVQEHAKPLLEFFRPYQKEGVSWLVGQMQQVGGALLADDMGLGKTLQTLSVIHTLQQLTPQKDRKPSLIVCPTSLVGNWALEINKWLSGAKTQLYTGNQRKRKWDQIPQQDFVITTYGTLARDIDELAGVEFHFCALDESSLIRNPKTKLAQAVYRINAHYRLALTGTPVENTVRDLWSIFHFIAPKYLGDLNDFRDRYEKPLTSTPMDISAMKRLQMRVEPFYLRRLKQEVAKDLPSKTEIIERVELSAEQKRWYQEILTQGQDRVDEVRKALGQGAAHMELLRTLLRLRQTCCDTRLLGDQSPKEMASKLERLLSILHEAQAGGHRVLIFSQFATMLKIIATELETAGMTYNYLDGQTRNRAKVVEDFQKEDGPLAFLISLKAGGYGLTLTKADIVIHFDPWWNPAVEAQATDRAHRIGQTKPVTVYKFITSDTVEEKVLQLQKTKKSFLEAALGDEEPLMEGLSTDEVSSLLGG